MIKRLTLRLDSEVAKGLDKLCESKNISMNEYINNCIKKSFIKKKQKSKNEISFECSEQMFDYYNSVSESAGIEFNDYINMVLMQRYMLENKKAIVAYDSKS